MWRRKAAAPQPPEEWTGAATDRLPVTPEAVRWAMRLMIGREPNSAEEVALHAAHGSLGALRQAFAEAPEFIAWSAPIRERQTRFAPPGFLRGRPADPSIPWSEEKPSLARPVSQLCTAAQFQEPAFLAIINELGIPPTAHRKTWEQAYIVAALRRHARIGPGRRAIGFGCGRERIPALLAAGGVEVLATDAPVDETLNQGWADTDQHSTGADELHFPEIVSRPAFDRLVRFRALDMNAIPADLAGQFDACWSACSLEHLGSLRHGLDFVEASLSVLRPGGVAVHTTEFNLTSDDDTIEQPSLSIYRRRDIEALLARLVALGHEVLPLKLDPGDAELDRVIDLPPYGLPHLKLKLGALTLTSIGLVIRRGA